MPNRTTSVLQTCGEILGTRLFSVFKLYHHFGAKLQAWTSETDKKWCTKTVVVWKIKAQITRYLFMHMAIFDKLIRYIIIIRVITRGKKMHIFYTFNGLPDIYGAKNN
jgi:hypothetical protein